MKKNWQSKGTAIILAIMILVVAGIGQHGEENKETGNKEVQVQSVSKESSNVNEKAVVINQPQKQVVQIRMKEHWGNGLIWAIDEEQIVIAANKHLLMEDTEGVVTFTDGQEYQMTVLCLSEQHDLGFGRIDITDFSEDKKDNIQSVLIPSKERWQELTMLGQDVLQISVMQNGSYEQNEGYVWDYQFIPQFNEEMLITKCFAKAGMSGGGIFSKEGYLLGMIAGGKLDENAMERESEMTYGISASVIEEEYQELQ